ncbi:hypothetical protein StoSoilB20_25010 [Arthrobacter sp. StoSoilB20]|nr:hypothetical protein StoSoilB20_25010 [Arthrobacter sp. StoSoilB20]
MMITHRRRPTTASTKARAAGNTTHGVKDSNCTTNKGHSIGTARNIDTPATGSSITRARTDQAMDAVRRRGRVA